LADSHVIEVSNQNIEFVPNFIGPGLPRRDKGDCEYYCLTMLVFFKPWCSGKDLKHANESWDKSFVNYNFTKRSCDIMDNFQLRYECLDSHDDFRAQRNVVAGTTLSNAILDYQDDIEYGDLDVFADSADDAIGTREKQRRNEMKEMDDILRRSGWHEPIADLSHTVPQDNNLPLKDSASSWQLTVGKKRQEVLDERQKNNSNTRNKMFHNRYPDQVEIMDKHVFEQKSRAGAIQNLIDVQVTKYTLNKEQERAFRIIANHAASPFNEQLNMYLGGMGGQVNQWF